MTAAGVSSTNSNLLLPFGKFSVSQLMSQLSTPADDAQGPAQPQGTWDSDRYQVQLTALRKQGSFSLEPVNPDVQTLQLEAQNKLEAHLLCLVE